MSHHHFWKLLSLSLTLSAPVALAQEAEEGTQSQEEARRFALGLRSGYGVPFGGIGTADGDEGGDLRDIVSGVIPLQLEAEYFFTSRLSLGASFQYGLAQFEDECLEGADCSARQLRFGLNLAYHFQPEQKLSPWVGLGVGYEVVSLSASGSEGGVSGVVESSLRGLEFASLQGGFDYRIGERFSVGPFVTFTAGQYSSSTTRIEIEGGGTNIDQEETFDIDEKEFHFWLYGGLRMQVRF
jgi:outer membrane protein W